MPSQNEATDSYLGYVFQGQYALLALWDSKDGDFVSVETADDVVIDGSVRRLSQLKHSLGTPPPLTITNVGFWKTVRIWIQDLAAEDASGALLGCSVGTTRYLFVTVAEVARADILGALVFGVEGRGEALAEVTRALVAEATRVRTERAAARDANRALPHTERGVACERFLEFTEETQRKLVERVVILPGNFRITDVPTIVESRLRDYVRAAQRRLVAERLIERWERQVTLALMGRRSRQIAKEELTGLISDLIYEFGPTSLPNDYGSVDPDPMEIAADVGGNIERQIVLVDGGATRIVRAIRDRWRARNQRERWMVDDASLVPLLKTHDDGLKEAWRDIHGPMSDDSRDLGDDERRRQGLGMLDWAYVEAPDAVEPPRPDSRHPFYVRGMLQQFADDLEIGWHPDYAELLGDSQKVSIEGVHAEEQHSVEATEGETLRDELPADVPLGKLRAPTGSTKPSSRQRRPRKAGAE